MTRMPDPEIGLIGMRRNEIMLAEGTDHMGAAEAGNAGQGFKPDILIEILGDIVSHPAHGDRFTIFRQMNDGAAMSLEHVGEHPIHTLLSGKPCLFFHGAMGAIEGCSQWCICQQLPGKTRRSVKGTPCHILYDIDQKRRIRVDHPVAVALRSAWLAVMNLAGIDEVQGARTRCFPLSPNVGNLTSVFYGTDRKRIMRMRRKFMRDEGGGQALHVTKVPCPPEARSFRSRYGRCLGGLLLRNIVHDCRIDVFVMIVLNKSDRVRRT